MWRSLLRALESTPVSSLDDLRPFTGQRDRALRCHVPGCASCAKFDTERRLDFEESTFRGAADVVSFDCSSSQHRRLAVAAGVSNLPAYILLSDRGTPRVLSVE